MAADFKGTELHPQMALGSFAPAADVEIPEEEKTLINAIELDPVGLHGVHPTDSARPTGRLGKDKQKMRCTFYLKEIFP